MKLRKTLFINDAPVKLVEEDVLLSLYSPGRAMFQVQSPEPLTGIVRLEVGYSTQDRDQVYFIGVIRSSEIVDGQQQRLRCRELTSALYAPLPAALRHPTLQEVAQEYTDRTGLRFVVPEKSYAEKRVPAFYALGSGFHGVDSLGAIFGIENYIWQQQGDGSVFVGSWKDSRWATRPVALDEDIFNKVTGTGEKKSAVLPQLRPGVLLNDRYVVRVKLKGHEMVTKCEKSLKKIILKLYPELDAGLHLPRFARVLAVNDAPKDGGSSERFRPRYAVDLEILTPNGERDDNFSIYEAVQLPVPVGCGQEAGLFGFPEPGVIVEIGFAYGRADHPIVRHVYPQGMSLPAVDMGQQRWQQSPAVFQDVDKDGNWTRKTDMAITDKSLKRVTEAVENLDTFSRELRTIHENSVEEIGGCKIIEALDALRLRSGGSANLVAVDNINFTTGRDRNLIVAQDRKEIAGRHHLSTVKGNLEETVNGSHTENVGEDRMQSTGGDHTSDVGGDSTENVGGTKTIAAPFTNIEGQTIRIGQAGDGVSLLPIIIQFMEEVRCALQDCADHVHPAIGVVSDQQGELAEHSGRVAGLKGKLGVLSG